MGWLQLALAAAVAGAFGALTFHYYRRYYFGRDPPRTPAAGARIVAPADGRVLYIAQVDRGLLPITIKNQRPIPLGEIVKGCHEPLHGTHVGLYLSPFDVHYQRSPIAGEVVAVTYHPAPRNLVMESMFWRNYLRMQPMHVNSPHILHNERNIIHIRGPRDEVFVVQIADFYVNRIDCYVRPGDRVEQGQKIGMIHAGSQVDLFVVGAEVRQFDAIQVGQHVLAASSPLCSA